MHSIITAGPREAHTVEKITETSLRDGIVYRGARVRVVTLSPARVPLNDRLLYSGGLMKPPSVIGGGLESLGDQLPSLSSHFMKMAAKGKGKTSMSMMRTYANGSGDHPIFLRWSTYPMGYVGSGQSRTIWSIPSRRCH